jgi:uncharacterized protein
LTQVTLDNTEVHQIRSEKIGQDYLLNVAVPPGYNASGEPCPVVYVTDGGPAFTALHSVVPLMQMSQELRPFIMVGITYNVTESMFGMTLRNRDLTHCAGSIAPDDEEMPEWYKNLPQVEPGGAAQFLDFISNEVKTVINDNYNVNDDATYAGYSLGGLFGLFGLFTKPETFERYVIGSPSIWWGEKDILQCEQAYADAHDDLKARVFMCSGRLEEPVDKPDNFSMVSNMTDLAQTLTNRNYSSLQLTHKILDEETHLSGHPLALLRGLRSVFT